jgi:hypothetical protein
MPQDYLKERTWIEIREDSQISYSVGGDELSATLVEGKAVNWVAI